MRIAICQINPIIADFEGNLKKIQAFLKRAESQQADIAVFPELALTGYPLGDLLFQEGVWEKIQSCLDQIIPLTQSTAAVIGMPKRSNALEGKHYYNVAAVLSQGAFLGDQEKILIPDYDVFDERRYFESGKNHKVFPIQGKKVSITICEDIWATRSYLGKENYATDPLDQIKDQKPDLLINISASPFHHGKIALRIDLAQKVARRIGVPFVLCNQVGAQDGLIFDGSSLAVSADGILADIACSFEEDLLVWDCVSTQKRKYQPLNEAEELWSALSLGVRDYFAKQACQKACLGISGGIDSAVVACIAVNSLGKENVMGLAMPSRYSPNSSLEDAERLCCNLGISLQTIPIEKPYQAYVESLAKCFGASDFGIVEENLQSRIRGMILMALSNKEGCFLLNTANKSECAMGYSTLYGDSCGAISVLGDVLKEQVYALARWINRTQEMIPFSILDKEPSAELRIGQKDTDSLPPYPIVDLVIKEYIEKMKSIAVICQEQHLPKELVMDLVQKIHRAEFKRRQSPCVLKVSEKAFGLGRYVPIVHKLLV